MRRSATIAGLMALTLGLGGCAASDEPRAMASATPSSPAPTPTHSSAQEIAAAQAAALPVVEQAALVVMGTTGGADAATLAGYVENGPAGLILMGSNVPAASADLRALTDAVHRAAPHALVATDQEGGDVRRLRTDDLPSARTLKTQDPGATRAAFGARAQLLHDAGIDANFGIVADVPRSANSFIFRRAFGTEPGAVAAHVAAAVAGEHGRVLSTLKHFPGHGAAEGDSHHAIPTTDETLEQWRSTDALPFQAGVDAGAELVMMGHLRFSAVSDLPASLAPEWYDILRHDLGFDGVAVTDDLGMLTSSGEPAYADTVTNAVAAVSAGADLVLVVAGSTPQTAPDIAAALTQRAQTDAAFAARLEDAAAHVLALARE